MSQPLQSPDPEGVKRLLQGGSEKLDVDPEVMQDLSSESTQPEDTRVSVPLDNSASGQMPSANNMLAWSMALPDTGEVTVTESEKALYLKAALNDVPLVLPIDINIGGTNCIIQCRALTTWEVDVLFGALNADEREDKFRDAAQYTTAMQQYMLAMQVESFNGVALRPLRFQADMNMDDAVSALRAGAKLLVGNWTTVKWATVLLGVRLFTIKVKLCTDAALNLDFWTPPGTD